MKDLRAFSIVVLLCLCFGNVRAQEVLIGDAHWPQQLSARYSSTPQAKPLTSTGPSLNLPFFDDFSEDFFISPNPFLWDTAYFHTNPTISLSRAKLPPTKGVITFDGANMFGQKYKSNSVQSGAADSLVSCPIDLSANTAADSIYLSFYLEHGGLGDDTEDNDSICIFFADTSGAMLNWQRIGSILGDSLSSEEFQLLMYPILDSNFFHDQFRIMFVSYGSLNGEFDLWHLDYVLLDANRSLGDTLLNDVSVTQPLSPLLGRWTAIPRLQYSSYKLHPNEVEVSNLFSNSKTVALHCDLTSPDPLIQASFAMPTQLTSSINVAGQANVNHTFSGFAQQFSRINTNGVIRVKTYLEAVSGDAFAQNDTMQFDVRIDSVLALDDGVSDGGYGLTTNKAFCQKYFTANDLPDTLTAVWINFTPTLNVGPFGQATCLDEKRFTIGIWNNNKLTGLPDTTIIQVFGGVKISYGNSPNDFIRYDLGKKIEVPAVFYVGIIQEDEMPIGIGVDKNNNNSAYILYQDNLFLWNLTNKLPHSTLMIRPEFKNVDSINVGNNPVIQEDPISFKAYPNPVMQDILNLEIKGNTDLLKLDIQLMDLQGRQVFRIEKQFSGKYEKLQLPSGIGNGMYILLLTAESPSGGIFQHSEKLILNR